MQRRCRSCRGRRRTNDVQKVNAVRDSRRREPTVRQGRGSEPPASAGDYGLALLALDKPAPVKPAAVKPVPDDENYCIQCHKELTEKDQKQFFVEPKDFAGDAHWQKGLRCQDCHGGDPTVPEIKGHQAKGDFRVPKSPAELLEFCGSCHKAERLELLKGVHNKAGRRTIAARERRWPAACATVHPRTTFRPSATPVLRSTWNTR